MPRPGRGVKRAKAIKGHVLLDERTQRRLSRIRWRRMLIGLCAVGLLAGVMALYFSPLLRVERVEVVGASTFDPAEVARLASLEGDSMLRLDLPAAGERVLFLPAVASVNMERRWPRTVRIQVTERQPWAVWQVGADSYVIDAEGVVMPQESQAPEGAPTIRDNGNPVRLIPGDRVDLDSVQLARSLIERLPGELALNIALLEYSPASGLTVTTDAGYRVVIGDSQNVDYKLAVWQKIEAELGREAMSGHVLDLRFGDRPSFQ